MKWFSQWVTRHRKAVAAVFLIGTAVSALLAAQIKTNENMADYLPENAQSTVALELMEAEFDTDAPNARVMVSGLSLVQAAEVKERLLAVDGVSAVTWLDDVISLKQPIEMADSSVVEGYYRDGRALYSVTIDSGRESEAVAAIYGLGEDVAITGDAASTAQGEEVNRKETTGAMLILVPLIIVVLLLTTTSWLEPALYLGTIGAAVLMNLGATALTGEISSVTMTISPILQLAVSLDYSIFLLHAFARHREHTPSLEEAMALAMRESSASIAASAATTLFGFLALVVMKFRIGPDMGLTLVKGILFSYLSVMVFLPALTLCCCRLLDRTRHRRLVPGLKGAGRALLRIRVPALILALVVLVPCFLAQSRTDFVYGNGAADPSTQYGADTARIDEVFGQSASLVILVPRGDQGRELELCRELQEVENVTSVLSYVTAVGAAIPEDYLDEAVTGQFYSEHYARIVLSCGTGEEGDEAFALVERVREITGSYYDTYYTCGQSANLYDMKQVVSEDQVLVNLLAIAAIALVLFFTFRSAVLPVLLLLVIETAIWINLSIPYFTGTSLSYIGYLVINTVQLGATIDYAILFTQAYLRERKRNPRRLAAERVLKENLLSILVSALTLAGAGFCLYLSSSNQIVTTMGVLLCRGTILSFLMVVCVLPALLLIFDRLIAKTTCHSNFFQGGISE